MKEIVRSHRITTSLAEYARSAGDAVVFADKNGYPIVAKPVDGFATINTAVLRNEADIQQYFDNFLITYPPLARVSTGKVLIETYSQGAEYVVDAVLREDEVVFSNVSKYSFDKCVEAVSKGAGLGLYPLPINDELTRALVAENKRVIAALGLTNTVTHAEFFVEPRTGKITFGEIAARVGGSSFYPQVIKHCYGVDFAELAFDTLMENVTDAAVTPHEFVPAAGFLLPAKAGKVRHIPTLNEMLEAAGVIEYHVNIHEGDVLTPINNTTGDTGMMILTADTLTDLLDRLAAAQKLFMEKLIVE
jgi:biotin carboxylase